MRRTAAVVLALLVLAVPPVAADASPEVEVRSILREAASPLTLQAVLLRSERLAAVGAGAEPALRASLAEGDASARLSAAGALLTLKGDDAAAATAAARIAREEPAPIRSLALAVMERHAGRETVAALLDLAEAAGDPLLRVEAALAAWRATRHPKARQALLAAANSPEEAIRRAAALAAAEAEATAQVRPQLLAIAVEPTVEGRLARSYLEQERLAALLAVKENPAFLGRETVLGEIVSIIQRHYVDERRVALEGLFDAAAQGIAAALDKHCEYLTPDEARLREEMFRGEYAGIGAQVTKDEANLIEIETAFYGGPAYNAGLRTGDRIVKIESTPVQEISLTEGVKLLRGPPGTPVTIEVMRLGWQAPQTFTLLRGTIHRDSVFREMLPGGIGYVRLVQFGEKSFQEMTEALDALERDGLRGLVIDVRGNGGGLLDAAVAITGQFLPAGALVVYTEGRSPDYGRREEYQAGGAYYQYAARQGGQIQYHREWLNPDEARRRGVRPPLHKVRPSYPIVMLVDKASASASEIFSGALKAHGRATLVGTTTYGKGSVQREIPLETSRRVKDGAVEQARMKITIAKYYLKDGTSIHGTGVKPDIEVANPEWEGWKFAAYLKLLKDKAFDRFFDEWYAKDKKRYEDLLLSGAPAADYPGYAAWAAAAPAEGLPPADLFRMFRLELRKRIASERGRPFPSDFPLDEDVPLQRAIVELAPKIDLDLGAVPVYDALGLARKFTVLPADKKEETPSPAE